jgi:Tol biopolymer transport system component
LEIRGSDVQFLADGAIVFVSGEALHREVWRMNLDGSARRRITASDGEKASLCVTAGGTKLLYLRSALYPGTAFRTPYTLYEKNLDGSGQTTVAELW